MDRKADCGNAEWRKYGHKPKLGEAADHLIKNCLEVRDVIALTEWWRHSIWGLFDETNKLDMEFFAHLSYVFNQVLQNIRKGGWSRESIEKSGKLLFRLWQVGRIYCNKKKRYSLAGWFRKMSELEIEALEIFGNWKFFGK